MVKFLVSAINRNGIFGMLSIALRKRKNGYAKEHGIKLIRIPYFTGVDYDFKKRVQNVLDVITKEKK